MVLKNQREKKGFSFVSITLALYIKGGKANFNIFSIADFCSPILASSQNFNHVPLFWVHCGYFEYDNFLGSSEELRY